MSWGCCAYFTDCFYHVDGAVYRAGMFFVNRASVLANEKIRLLQEILEQQRIQTALLQSLAPATVDVTPSEPETVLHPSAASAPEFDAFNVIPER